MMSAKAQRQAATLKHLLSSSRTRSVTDERRQLWIKTTADALDLATEIWPGSDGAVYLTAEQWQRLRQVLLTLPDLGD